MKSIITITALLLLLSFQTFSQDKNHKRELLEKINIEKLMEMHKSNVDALEGLNDNKYWLLNPKNRRWEQVLRNQQEGFYIEDEFNIKESRTIIKKTLLGDGFLLIEYIIQEWDGTAWLNATKSSNTYDGNNNLTEVLFQSWDGSAWVNASKTSNTYDGNNNLTEVLIQSWDGSAWVNATKISNTYDGNNNLTEVLFQSWDGSAWVNSFKTSNTYDGNNNLTEVLSQIWDGSAWVNFSKSFYTYDGNNNLTEVLSQSWDGSAWVNSLKTSNTYDGNNNLTEVLLQSWSGSAWVNSSKTFNTYDGNNNLTEVLSQIWDGSVWVNLSKTIYFYIPTGIGQFGGEVNTYSLSSNYPNPFNPTTIIEYSLPQYGFVTLTVYDMLGREIATLVNEEKSAGNYKFEYNAGDLASGIYYYHLNVGNEFVETRKMVLLR